MKTVRTILLTALALVLGTALAVSAAAAQASPPDQHAYRFVLAQDANNRAQAPLSHTESDVPSQDNYGALIRNHFGNPASGVALLESWTRQTYSDLALPINNQGFARAVRTYKVKRIAIRVILHTRSGSDNDDATGPTFNNGSIAGNPRIFNATSPTISTGGLVSSPQFCESWTTVAYAIRWDDDTLTQGSFDSPADLWNDNCYFDTP